MEHCVTEILQQASQFKMADRRIKLQEHSIILSNFSLAEISMVEIL